MSITIRKDGNLNAEDTDMPVTKFLTFGFKPQHIKIAGLLDYGYSPRQIGKEINMTEASVLTLMKRHGYVTADVLLARPLQEGNHGL